MRWMNVAMRWGGLLSGWLLVAMGPAQAAELVQGRVIVRLKSDAALTHNSVVQAQAVGAASGSRALMQRLGRRHGLVVDEGRDIGSRMHVAVASGLRSSELAALLAQDADVEYAVPDKWRKPFAAPNDPLYAASVSNTYVATGQWYLRAPVGVTTPSAINAEGAWPTATGSGVSVAVLDSGVRFDHPDLGGGADNKLRNGYNMIWSYAVSQVHGRSADASDLGDWVTDADIAAIRAVSGEADCTLQARSSWHGTQVAGIVGAKTNNGQGMAGVAPDAQVLPVRVLGKCGGWDSDIIAGMRWAAGITVDNIPGASPGAQVLNLSLGAPDTCSQAYKDVIRDLTALRVVIVASAGNDRGLAVSTPANCPGVIAVSGLRHVGTKVTYSSLGPEVTVAAPGGNCVNGESGPCLYPILSTTNSGGTQPKLNNEGGSEYTDSVNHPGVGTSFAAPQVSGTVAMMLQARSDLTPVAVAALLKATATSFPSSGVPDATGQCRAPGSFYQDECYCTQTTCGGGMLNAAAAVHAAANDPVAVIQVNPVAPMPHQAIQLSGMQSMGTPDGQPIVGFTWRLLDGGGIVNDTGWAANSSVVTLTPTGAGMFKVRLTVRVSETVSTFSDQWVVVGSISNAATTAAAGEGGGGGGGGGVDRMLLLVLVLMLIAQGMSISSSKATPLTRADMA